METLNMEKLVEVQILLYINRNRNKEFAPVIQHSVSKSNVDMSTQMTETKNDKLKTKR